jgi:hypothetical protein
VVLAALSSTGFWIVAAAWLGLCLLAFLLRPRDIQGRRRATGCIFGLTVFFGLFVIALASWAADHVF